MKREGYLRLLPGYVRRFVARAASLLHLEIRGDLDGFFALSPRRPGALDPLLAALESYPAEARERLCVRRPDAAAGERAEDAPCIWLHPGEPLFDALSGQVLAAFDRDARRGAIFTDPRAEAPYFLHMATASVERERAAAAQASLPPAVDAEEPHARRIVERRLLGLRHDEASDPAETPVERLLLLRGAPQIPPGAAPLAGRGIAMRAEAAAFAERNILDPMAAAQRKARRAELPERRRRVAAGFDLRAADLAARRVKLARNATGPEAGEALDAVKREQRVLAAEKARVLAAIDAAPDRIVSGGLRFLVHTLVVPAADPGEMERYDARVEEIALRIAIAWERDRGGEPRDVSRPELARLAGLPDWPGFDLLSSHGEGETRGIEVKGRAGGGAIQMEANEWKQACHLGERYWLYAVFDCATPAPRLLRVRDPFAKLLAGRRDSAAYAISAAALREAAEWDR